MLDLLIQNVQLPRYREEMNIGVADGRIILIQPSVSGIGQATESVDAKGCMLFPGLVESHIHLEKAYLLSEMKQEATSLREAIHMTAKMKAGFTKEKMRSRAIRVLKDVVLNGVTHLRCHVEVDPILQLQAMEVMLELKESLGEVIDLQIVVFPQEGIFNQPGTAELMEEAVRMGADVIRGISYNDREVDEHLNFVFDLSEKYGKPIDFHVDFSDNPSELTILSIATKTIERGMQGKVVAGHVTSLGSTLYDSAAAAAERIAEAGIHIVTLPATDLYLNGRGDTEKVRRGLTPVSLLLQNGVNVIFGTNNIQNAFTPFGKGDPLDIAWLLAQTSYFGTKDDARILIEMMTTRAARALNIPEYGIEVGAYADFILVQASSIRDVLLYRPERQGVWKKGKLVAKTSKRQELLATLE